MSSKNTTLIPDFVFESSWEVCHKIGGIYTVLSTHALELGKRLNDQLLFIGPDLGNEEHNALFTPDADLFGNWEKQAAQEGLKVKTGRWNIPGNPKAILVDFHSIYEQRDELYTEMWELYKVDSLHAYGDYDEANMFSIASAKVAESFYRFHLSKAQNVVYHAHEWMTCMGVLYLQRHVPEIASTFTTHATSIGRSIAGNGKPLYEYLWAYNGTQMSQELNIESKHSLEERTAHFVDCFTTVSEVTARECTELLGRTPDVILNNGFEPSFVPKGNALTAQRRLARQQIFKVASALTGHEYATDTMIVATSGRYEYRNKGIDIFLDSISQCSHSQGIRQQILALVEVPGWVSGPRSDLKSRLDEGQATNLPLQDPFLTHQLVDRNNDMVYRYIKQHGFRNTASDPVNIIFAPSYLDGKDGIFERSYYELLAGVDIAIYPSYYEPWGYTPLEAIAFHVPCITTSLSGFGAWVNTQKKRSAVLEDGVEVISRTDYNHEEVVNSVCHAIERYSLLSPNERKEVRRKAYRLSQKADWKHFIPSYLEAYEVALDNRNHRINNV